MEWARVVIEHQRQVIAVMQNSRGWQFAQKTGRLMDTHFPAGTRRRPLPPGRASAPATRAPEARSQDSEHDGPVVKIADIAAGVFGTGPRHD